MYESWRLSLKVRTLLAAVLLPAALLGPTALRAQDLVKDALQSFPTQSVRLEYSNSAKLRKLPDYTVLRQRYLGPQLQKLEKSLSQLGIQESDVDELVLGWQAGSSGLDLNGLALGRFNSKSVATSAAGAGFSPSPMADQTAYCFGPETTDMCAVVLGDSEGAFGTRSSLAAMLEARAGRAANLSSNSQFKTLMDEARTEAPIWGVAVGPGVADWFKGSMPGQENLQLDWSQAFATVQALSYRVDAGDKVNLQVRLDCTTTQAASSLRQLLDGLKTFQQLAWQNQHPNQPNPFQALEVDSAGQRVNLKLIAPYPSVKG